MTSGWGKILAVATVLGAASFSLARATEPTNTAALAIPTNGLVLYYSFDVDVGETVADDSGNKRAGTVCGAAWTTNGASGGAYEFDGTKAYIDLSSHASALGLSSGSLSIWFKYRPNGGSTACPALYTVGTQGDKYNYGYLYAGDASGGVPDESLYFHGPANGSLHIYVPRGNACYQDSQWHHVVVVADGEDNRIFVDGVREKVLFERGSTTTGGQFLFKPGANRFCLGQDFIGPSYFHGAIDEVRIYNRALDGREVEALYLGVRPAEVPEALAKEIPALVEQLGHDDSKVRRAAKARLKAIGRAAYPVLVRRRDDPDPEIRASVEELLKP